MHPQTQTQSPNFLTAGQLKLGLAAWSAPRCKAETEACKRGGRALSVSQKEQVQGQGHLSIRCLLPVPPGGRRQPRESSLEAVPSPKCALRLGQTASRRNCWTALVCVNTSEAAAQCSLMANFERWVQLQQLDMSGSRV